MPFPLEIEYINETEEKMNVKFPEIFKAKMMKDNGGEIESEDYFFMLVPFLDRSSRKRISRTCNDIIQETQGAKEYGEIFPDSGVVIGSDNFGNLLILLPKSNTLLGEEIYLWDHETGELKTIANDINEFYE